MLEPLTDRGRALLSSIGLILCVEPPRIVYPRPKRRASNLCRARWLRERAVREAFGLCVQKGCVCAALLGRKRCEKHTAKQREYQARSRAIRA